MAAVATFSATSSESLRYQEILNKKIAEGARSALHTVERIQSEVPVDQIVSTRGVDFAAGEHGLTVIVGDEQHRATDYAIGQIAQRADVPTDYLRRLSASKADGWQHDLAAEVLRRSYRNRPTERVLSRSVNGQIRGWLSDRFRRIDARPLVDALVGELSAIGAVPYHGAVTDTRVTMKALLPTIIEPVPGEFMVLGLSWGTSDYGNGSHWVSQFGLRVACLNGLTRESILRETHIGGRLSENIEWSRRTLEADTRASTFALRDTVRGVLGEKARDTLVDQIRSAHDRDMSAAQLRAATKTLPAKTQKAVVDAFESSDVINLPAGNTAWRASNAVSWIARHVESDEDRIDLERLAGKLV
jgi:hypothetical protein